MVYVELSLEEIKQLLIWSDCFMTYYEPTDIDLSLDIKLKKRRFDLMKKENEQDVK